MSEDEIRRVFQNSVFGAQFDGKKQCPSPAVAVMTSEDRDIGNVLLKLFQRQVMQYIASGRESMRKGYPRLV
jgi:hypothetical protein